MSAGIDLLLSHGYCLADDEHERAVMMPYPPLGMLYLSSHLKGKGFAVEVYDTTFGSVDGFADALAASRPRVLGLSCNLMTRGTLLRMAAMGRDAGAVVVAGGPEAGPNAEEYLRHGVDVVVVGEGELTLEELLRHLQAHGRESLHQVRGIAYLDGAGAFRATPPRPLLRPLSAQPWPDRAAVDMGAYLRAWRGRHGFGSVSLITARGCPYTCTWCSHGVFGRTHRRREVAEVADEVAWIAETYAPERLWYADDVFTHNRPWTMAFAAELARRKLRLPFECISRADRLNPQVADALAETGCFRLWLGSESGSQRLLDRMGRLTRLEEVEAATVMLQARGIQVGMFMMLGYEDETEADLEATVEHLKRSAPDLFLTTVAYPIRGTEYHQRMEGLLRSDRPWAGRTDRDLRIAGRHSRRYYDHATRWLVNEVNAHLEWRRGSRDWLRLGRMLLAARRGRLGMWFCRREREEEELAGSGRGWEGGEARARGDAG